MSSDNINALHTIALAQESFKLLFPRVKRVPVEETEPPPIAAWQSDNSKFHFHNYRHTALYNHLRIHTMSKMPQDTKHHTPRHPGVGKGEMEKSVPQTLGDQNQTNTIPETHTHTHTHMHTHTHTHHTHTHTYNGTHTHTHTYTIHNKTPRHLGVIKGEMKNKMKPQTLGDQNQTNTIVRVKRFETPKGKVSPPISPSPELT